MKLNHDCVRHLLLSIESWDSHGTLKLVHLKEMPLLADYSDDEILYAALKLKEKQFINAAPVIVQNRLYNIDISGITWDGHAFLDNIRDNQVWKETKNAATVVKGASLSIMAEFAKNYISSKLGLV